MKAEERTKFIGLCSPVMTSGDTESFQRALLNMKPLLNDSHFHELNGDVIESTRKVSFITRELALFAKEFYISGTAILSIITREKEALRELSFEHKASSLFQSPTQGGTAHS
jgi:hypothetical protein